MNGVHDVDSSDGSGIDVDNGGATVRIQEEAKSSDYFNLFWTDGWWDHLVAETNRYAADQGPNEKWSSVDVTDMKVFIGLMLAMGILQCNVMKDYWRQTKRLFKTQFGKVMARDRFLLIWRYLYLADNDAPNARGEGRDRLPKLRPMINQLNMKFKENYTPY
ncbi:PiggyBac transposable element-derived protein 4 [Elysia marginata]|uniref:PiggyBac transposable element-derived protein 4 n=1 Tax=Elysia marginata TaxID=1093978 RepID=A0AAV4ELY7_9GAST|nr:PiggyBac transposable element-derived protein 4 [Elysia marginata]